jgi:PAS domain S-box-containing protein
LIPIAAFSELDPEACHFILDEMFSRSSSALAVLDTQFRFVCVNKAFTRYSCVPEKEHFDQTVDKILGAAAWSDIQPHLKQALTGARVSERSFAAPQQNKAPSASEMLVSMYPLGKPNRYFGILVVVAEQYSISKLEIKLLHQAVTASIERQKHLLDQQSRLELALSSGKLGTWQLSLVKEQLIDASYVCKAAFGYGPDEPFGYQEIVNTIHPDDRPAVLQAVHRSRETGKEYEVEYRCIWRDGTEHWISAAAQPTYDETGQPVTLIGISQDISQRKNAEREKSLLLAKISEFASTQAAFLRDVLASVTDGKLHFCQLTSDLPSKGLQRGNEIQLTASGGLSELRHASKGAALDLGYSDERWHDLITAVSEAGMNAVVHGGGGSAYVYTVNDRSVQVWVVDTGKGIELENLPRATLEKGYTTMGTMGHGMKIMLQAADRIWLLTGTSGTTLVIEQDREAIKREWT